jgi:hypothetical protein
MAAARRSAHGGAPLSGLVGKRAMTCFPAVDRRDGWIDGLDTTDDELLFSHVCDTEPRTAQHMLLCVFDSSSAVGGARRAVAVGIRTKREEANGGVNIGSDYVALCAAAEAVDLPEGVGSFFDQNAAHGGTCNIAELVGNTKAVVRDCRTKIGSFLKKIGGWKTLLSPLTFPGRGGLVLTGVKVVYRPFGHSPFVVTNKADFSEQHIATLEVFTQEWLEAQDMVIVRMVRGEFNKRSTCIAFNPAEKDPCGRIALPQHIWIASERQFLSQQSAEWITSHGYTTVEAAIEATRG